jgi:hypothetical protein
MEMANESDDENVELISRKQFSQRPDLAPHKPPVVPKTHAPAVSEGTDEGSFSLSRRAVIGALIVLAFVVMITIFPASSPTKYSQSPTIPPPDSDAAFNNADYLKSSSDIVSDALIRIKDYWRVKDYPFFLSAMDIPAGSWEIQKNKFILQIIRQHTALTSGRFVVAFTGSSVTAGHDNFVSDMYSEVFQQTCAPSFAALNITLEVRPRDAHLLRFYHGICPDA